MKKHLKSLGFKKKWLDDKSGFWWEKECHNPFFTDLRVLIDDIKDKKFIFVSCQDADDTYTLLDSVIHRTLYSKDNLNKVLEYFNTAWEVAGIGTEDADSSVKHAARQQTANAAKI